jgi:hypothetical protein
MWFFICFESNKQFFIYLATVTITDDRAAKLDLCTALTVFTCSSNGSFTCHTYCNTGPLFLRSYPKDPWFYLPNTVLMAEEQFLPILNILGLTWPVHAGLELTTFRLLSESTPTRLRSRYIIHFSIRCICILSFDRSYGISCLTIRLTLLRSKKKKVVFPVTSINFKIRVGRSVIFFFFFF